MAQFPNPYNAQGVWSLRSQLVARMGNNWPGVVTVTEIFTSSTTWTCPTGVTAVDYFVVARGGGGGDYDRNVPVLTGYKCDR